MMEKGKGDGGGRNCIWGRVIASSLIKRWYWVTKPKKIIEVLEQMQNSDGVVLGVYAARSSRHCGRRAW